MICILYVIVRDNVKGVSLEVETLIFITYNFIYNKYVRVTSIIFYIIEFVQ